MKSKIIGVLAGIAFILSFLTALFSGAGFLIALLRGCGFGVAFAALGVGINFLYNKFLSESQPSGSIDENQNQPAQPVPGAKVNLVVGEEALSDDEDSPKFTLTGSSAILGSGDREQVSKPAPSVSAGSTGTSAASASENRSTVVEQMQKANQESAAGSGDNAGFRPVALGTPAQNEPTDEFPPIEGILNNSVFSPSRSDGDSSEEPDVDVIPDLGPVHKSSDETITDSEFASNGKTTSRLNETRFSDGSSAASKDAKLLAEAIRTTLKKSE
ncbi:MAG: hypothetical protein MJ169_06995 [Treponema sp.]|nr:hypothetical protein [Treponema sp.]